MVKPWIYSSFVTILLTSGAWISRVDLIACIYSLYIFCRLSELLIVLSIVVQSILNLSRSILSSLCDFGNSFCGWSR